MKTFITFRRDKGDTFLAMQKKYLKIINSLPNL